MGGGVFEARIKQIAALNLVLRPVIRIPGRKSPNWDLRRIPGRKSPNWDPRRIPGRKNPNWVPGEFQVAKTRIGIPVI